MLIVPIRSNDSTPHRAWVTYGLVAVNVLFFFMFCVEASDRERAELMESWRSCITYLRERPYLQVPPHADDLMPADVRGRVARPDRSVPGWRASKEQDTINDMARDLYKRYGDVPDIRMAFIPGIADPWTVLTSMFLHGGVMHLIGNMLFLLAIGPFVEEAVGRLLFTLLYLTGGVAATLGFAAMHPGLMQPLVGASGAIAALMGAYLVRFALSHIDFLFIPIVFLPALNYRFSVRAILFLPIWLLEQLVSIPMEGDSGVAVTAHVAGFVYGFAFLMLFRIAQIGKRVQPTGGKPLVRAAVKPAAARSADPRLERAEAAFRRRDIPSTRRELSLLLAEQPSNPAALRLAIDLALFEEEPESADPWAATLMSAYISAGDSAAARQLMLELQPLAARNRMPQFIARAAAWADRTGDRPQAIALFERLCEIEAATANVIPSLVKLATLRRARGDIYGAREALARALRHPECSAEWRRKIDSTMSMIG